VHHLGSRSPERCTVTPPSRGSRVRETLTSMVSSSSASPQSRAALRWEANPPVPHPSTAACTCCSHVDGAPATRSACGCTRSRRPARTSRLSALSLRPSSSSWLRPTSPCWRRAASAVPARPPPAPIAPPSSSGRSRRLGEALAQGGPPPFGHKPDLLCARQRPDAGRARTQTGFRAARAGRRGPGRRGRGG
jgi:hypothetical protein